VSVTESNSPTGGGTPDAPNDVVRYLDISADTQVQNDVEISTDISQSAFDNAGFSADDAVLLHFVDGSWQELDDTDVSVNGNTVTLTATASSLSPFAIGESQGEKNGGGDNDSDDDDGGGGGGGGGAPPSATDGTGVDEPNILTELGDQATIITEYEAIITDESSTRSTATFGDRFPLLQTVSFEKSGPFADEIDGTVNARAIDGDPTATGTPDGTIVGLAHITMPNENVSQVELAYKIPDSRLSELDASAEDISVYRFEGSNWETIDTEISEETETGTILTAELPDTSTSYFALTAPTAEGDVDSEATDGSVETASDDSIPGFGIIASLLAVIAVIGILSRRG
jgi:PGF-pre-PGF domain-containing protein/PGF-CTERM protein